MTDLTLAAAAAASPLAKILMAAGQVGYHWDLKADHIIWFGEWQKLFGYDRTHPPYNAETFAAVIVPEDHHLVFGANAATIDRDYRLRLANGHVVWVHEQGTVESDASGQVRQCGMIVPVASPAQHEAASDGDAVNQDLDELTKRPTRNFMAMQLSKLLTGATEERRSSAYLVIGVDKMAFINEAIGTKAADSVLCNVAAKLVELAPAKAMVARVGGDMFGILLPGSDGRSFGDVANKILMEFRETPVATTNAPLFITVSIGAIRLADQGPSAAEVMIRSEQALNEARLRGRNVMVEYQVSTPHIEARRTSMEMGERFKHALQNNKLKLAFQPIIDAQTGQVVFYEALIRMFKENGEIIPACDFVPAIEEQGMALELDYHVLDMTLKEMTDYPELRLAMNISGWTASRADWPEYLATKLRAHPGVAERLIVEITETVAISDLSETKRFAETLNKLGGSVAIDDFGAGFTSIRHLSTLSLSIMKVDRDMLRGVPGNAEQEHLVRMMIAIARGLGMKTVVEGVETEEVARWLIQEKADMMQGYYFGRPSIDRPWIALKGAEMSQQKAQSLFGNKLFSANSPTQLRVGSFSTSS